MNIEQKTREFCPFAGEAVIIIQLFSVENGGGCQIEISVSEISCERVFQCPEARTSLNCLLTGSAEVTRRGC